MSLLLFAKQLPMKPGVYCMLSTSGAVLYVGKAKNLQARVSSYFNRSKTQARTALLISQVEKIDVTLTSTENEALLLEANLIKAHKPKYNVLLRDDKSYPYIYLSTQHAFPRLALYRGAKSKQGRYFGPFPSVSAVRDNLNLLQKLFKIRNCTDSFMEHRRRPCLQYQIQRCTAPCVNFVSEEAYAEQVRHVELFLSGKNDDVAADLQRKMQVCSKQKQYEKAAELRDKIRYLREILQTQCIEGETGNVDVFAIHTHENAVVIAVLFVRGGRLLGQKSYFPRVPDDVPLGEVLASFISQYFYNTAAGQEPLDRVVVNVKLDNKLWLQDTLRQTFGKKFRLIDSSAANYKPWFELAHKNAIVKLQQHLHEKMDYKNKWLGLQQLLDLPQPIQRIECFDISHTSGVATIASCVVFNENGAMRNYFRRFNIKGITPGDDYAAMYQALKRRYAKLKANQSSLPDLIMIDGGKGQLKQAALVMQQLKLTGVILLGVAKGKARKAGEETLYLWDQKRPMQLSANTLALQCIQIIRDEAHRFAITTHRRKRDKKMSHSTLEDLPGIGPKRRQAILTHFGGMQALQKATAIDISKVSGVSQTLARAIYLFLHGEN